jgi:hypothetical protein
MKAPAVIFAGIPVLRSLKFVDTYLLCKRILGVIYLIKRLFLILLICTIIEYKEVVVYPKIFLKNIGLATVHAFKRKL